MSLRGALDRLIVLEAAVSVTSPVTISVAKAYKLVPPQSQELADLPCMMNICTFISSEMMNGMRTLYYRVQIQCAVAKLGVEDDRSADIAVALWEKLLDDLGADISLNGNVNLALFEEESSEIPAVLDRGVKYVGFSANLRLRTTAAFTAS